uniref:Global nitrogen transcriptional regulator n=1 Tax=Schimmelmannia schousboei TaxID=173468 RepID=A0A1C9C8Y8_9FLOR|nr:global nitrogen transcriptional regulator [Schimmelmannia schousboei]AOM64832.1 global nitrogen transcriptional regulator [Schimmelmannia schousboei]
MKWINNFLVYQIPFYIYKLNTGDAIVYTIDKKKTKSFIILNGVIFLLKIFTNEETLSLAILNKNHLIDTQNNIEERYSYYKAIALEETYIMSFQVKDFIYNSNISKNIKLSINLIESYKKTMQRYEEMNRILTHKYIKYRVIQFILFLCENFSGINKKKIVITFHIPQIMISIITGSNKVTISKIIRELCYKMLIEYSNQRVIYITDPFALSYFISKKLQ